MTGPLYLKARLIESSSDHAVLLALKDLLAMAVPPSGFNSTFQFYGNTNDHERSLRTETLVH